MRGLTTASHHLPAPVAQGIEHRPPEAGAQVRILPGAPCVRAVDRRRDHSSEAGLGDDSSRTYRSDEGFVVAFVLVGVGHRKIADGLVETVAGSQV